MIAILSAGPAVVLFLVVLFLIALLSYLATSELGRLSNVATPAGLVALPTAVLAYVWERRSG
jgi:hypothetical protein